MVPSRALPRLDSGMQKSCFGTMIRLLATMGVLLSLGHVRLLVPKAAKTMSMK
jgi:hypothetical protein